MKPAFVRLRLPGGDTRELGPGEIIGRAWSAHLQFDDPRISEAHALVSLRGATLRLLALRGRFKVDGRQRAEVDLRVGLTVSLARGIDLVVDAVELPAHAMGLAGPGLPRQVLSGVCSLVLAPRPSLRPGFHGSAAAWFWSAGGAWTVRCQGQSPRPLLPDDTLELAGAHFTAVAIPVDPEGAGATLTAYGQPAALHIVARYDGVQILRPGMDAAVFGGVSARLVSELVAMGGTAAWDVLAGELWPDAERAVLRNRLDVSLNRLRRKLRAAGIRTNLVQSDGAGCVQLVLHARDQVEDQT